MSIRRRVKKEDHTRILLTETFTLDVPLTFSNIGFYWHWKKFTDKKSYFSEILSSLFSSSDPKSYTIPYTFKIRKDENGFRHLSLIHPFAQVKFIDFYKNFDSQILLSCNRSKFTVRSPEKVGGKYYARSVLGSGRYRSSKVSLTKDESRSKYLNSYFTYRNYTKLHHFYDSAEFRKLEKRFLHFTSTDIAHCFDSVYTHSITWAQKNKPFAKTHRSVSNAFASIFDRLMQSTNYNETAGIVIGSEVSRIFAEIILQEVDEMVFSRLEQLQLVFGVDYAIRRYVDDILIFSHDNKVNELILGTVSDCLKEFKFSLNLNKTHSQARPFITIQSKAISLAKAKFKGFTDSVTSLAQTEDGTQSRQAKFIFNRQSLMNAFLQEIKSICLDSPSSYALVSGYILASSANLLIKTCDQYVSGNEPDRAATRLKNLAFLMLDLIFHLYTIHPTVANSVKIGICINRAIGYFEKELPDEVLALKSHIYVLAIEFFESSNFISISEKASSAVPIEALNILIAIRELGENHLISRDLLQKVIGGRDSERISYFEITSLLYYIGDDVHGSYSREKSRLLKAAKQKLSSLQDLKMNSEKLHLLLDLLACPYIDCDQRKKWLSNLRTYLGLSKIDDPLLTDLAQKFLKHPWFTTWNSADLANHLEKKALIPSY